VGALGGNASSQGVSLLGYSANPSPTTPNSGITPAFNWNSGFPAYTAPPFFDPTLNTGYNTTEGATGGGVSYNRPATAGRSAYTLNWNFTVEQQLLPSTVWSLTYSASTSRLVPIDGGFGTFSGQLNPQYLALGNLLLQQESPATLAQAQAMFPGISVPYPAFVGSIGQMLRPYPQYSSIGDASADFGTSSYNSFQSLLQRTMARGLYVLASYTWSKEIDDSGGNAFFGASSDPRTAYNIKQERAPGVYNNPQAISVAYVYQLPFGRGHALGGGNALTDKLTGGWQLSGLDQYSSGLPLGPITASCNVPYASSGNSCYADYNPAFLPKGSEVRMNGNWGSGSPRGATPPSYININAFQNPASFTFGDTPRTAPFGLANPWNLNESLSLAKTFQTEKNISIKVQADAFNMFNRVVFGGINASITSTAFGTVSSQSNSPRNLQFEATIKF
jgi:hypothetical protein